MPGGGDPVRPGQTWMPLHPHNAPLQLWLELGVPGAVVFALLVALAWLALAEVDWPRPFAAAAGASLMAALVASLASYGVWEEWWLSTLWFALFAILVMAGSPVMRQPAGDFRAHLAFTKGRWPSRSELPRRPRRHAARFGGGSVAGRTGRRRHRPDRGGLRAVGARLPRRRRNGSRLWQHTAALEVGFPRPRLPAASGKRSARRWPRAMRIRAARR